MPEIAALAALSVVVTVILRVRGVARWKAFSFGLITIPLVVQVAHFSLPGGLIGPPESWGRAALANSVLGAVSSLFGLLWSIPVEQLLRRATRAGTHSAGWRGAAGLVAVLPLIASVATFGWPTLPFVRPSASFKDAVAVSVCDVEPRRSYSVPEQGAVCVALPVESFRRSVANARYKYDRGFWKGGAKLVIVKLPNGESRRLEVSYHWGVFRALDEPGIWVLPEAESKAFATDFQSIIRTELLPRR